MLQSEYEVNLPDPRVSRWSLGEAASQVRHACIEPAVCKGVNMPEIQIALR